MFLHKRNKIWYIHFVDFKGKRQKVSTNSSIRLIAEKYLKKFSADSDNSLQNLSIPSPVAQNSIDLLNFKNRVYKYAKVNYSYANVDLYRRVLNNLIQIIGNKNVEDISVFDIEKYKANRMAYVSKTSVNIELRTLRAILNIAALKWEIIPKNPAKNVQQLPIPEKEILSLSDEETNKLLDTIEDYRFKRIVLFALHTGCRASEITNLEWSDVDLSNRVISIRNKPTFKTKTGKLRQIPINDTLFRLFTQFDSKIINVNGFVFTNKDGLKYRRDFLTYRFKHYVIKTGLDKRFHFHCTRHTFITKLIRNNVSIYKAMKLAGHSEIKTTLGYTHMIVEDLRDAVEVVNY